MATGPDQGLFRIGRDGAIEMLPGTSQIVFANALAFDPSGNLYVTESYSGAPGAYGPGGIWRIPPGGQAEVWIRHPLLSGIGYLGYPVGANGIAYYHRDLYVANTDKAMVVRIPVSGDGTPGEPTVWKPLEPVAGLPPVATPLPIMPDGLALDVHGNVYLAIVSRNAIVRINAEDLAQETVAVLMTASPGSYAVAPLDTPASLAFGTGAGEQQNLFVTNLGWMVTMAPPGRTWPGPGLVKVDGGFPGRPLQ
jgi:sugar lactone lactonase YvrE